MQVTDLYLAENKGLRLFTLCGLYVAQGIPWGFVTVTFAAWLADPQQGMTTEQIGPILAVATLPWSFKFLWGPLMDRFTIPSVGRRRPWIIFAQVMAILVLGSMAFVSDPAAMVWTADANSSGFRAYLIAFVPGPLAAMILLANVFVSMQDVAVDALAVDLLDEDERATANGMMYGCSYLGTAIGGRGLGEVVSVYGIHAGMICQALLLGLIVMLPMFVRERRVAVQDDSDDTGRTDTSPDSSGVRPPSSQVPQPPAALSFRLGPLLNRVAAVPTAVVTLVGEIPGSDFFRVFRLRSPLLGAVLAIGVRIGVGVLTAVFVDYLLKKGGWTQAEYTSVVGGTAVAVGLAGSVAGGFLADRIGPRTMIAITSVSLGLMWCVFGIVPDAIQSSGAIKAMLLTQEALLSMMSVSLFALFMGLSWPKIAATQFTTYMALMNLSTTIGSYVAEVLSRSLTIHEILIVAGLLQIVLLLPLCFIDPVQTRRELGDT